MKRLVVLIWLVPMPATAHENHTPFAAAGIVWKLIEIDGKPFDSKALVEFPKVGRIQGQAPCNRFFGALWSAYPWFKPENLATTRMACPALKAETRFLHSLANMSLADVAGDSLILSGDDGQTMRFIRLPRAD